MTEPTLSGAFYFHDFKGSYLPQILEEIYIKKIYLPFVSNILKGTVVDIGGNCGIFSYFVAEFAERVVALEPSEIHRANFNKMLEYNKITNVKLLPYALSNKNGEATLHHTPNNTAFSLHKHLPDQTSEQVKTVTIGKLMEEEKIDRINFLKLDCEGEEFKILASEEFKSLAPKIDAMLIELHDWMGVNFNQPITVLRDLGYHVTKLETDAFCIGAVRK